MKKTIIIKEPQTLTHLIYFGFLYFSFLLKQEPRWPKKRLWIVLFWILRQPVMFIFIYKFLLLLLLLSAYYLLLNRSDFKNRHFSRVANFSFGQGILLESLFYSKKKNTSRQKFRDFINVVKFILVKFIRSTENALPKPLTITKLKVLGCRHDGFELYEELKQLVSSIFLNRKKN